MPISMLKTRRGIFCTFLGFYSLLTYSQAGHDLGNVLSDLALITGRYVAPAADASVYQSTASWYTSAKSLEKFEVDVSIYFNALPIAQKQKTYNIADSEFNNLDVRGGSNADVPTALGGDTSIFYDFSINGEAYEMQAFEGIKENVVIHPYLQASIGLWAETDLTLRYSPSIKIDFSDYQIFGGAVKHSISQYFRPDDGTSFIEVAGLVSYSTFDLNLIFDPFELKSSDESAEPLAIIDRVIVDADAWLFQLIGSKEFGSFEVAGAFGYTSSNVHYVLGGDDGYFLDSLNIIIDQLLEETRSGVKGDLVLNYHFNNFYISTGVTLGKFLNSSLSFHYKF